MIYGKQEISFTVSIGVAAIGGNADDINDIEVILKRADDALYKAKAKGRNCVVTLGSGMEDVTPLEAKKCKPAYIQKRALSAGSSY